MNREETIALFLENQKRPGAWNEWAEGMLREKEELKKAGKWEVIYGGIKRKGRMYFGVKSKIPETIDWLCKATADFSSVYFLSTDTDEDITVTKLKKLSDCSDQQDVCIKGGILDCSQFIFPGSAWFNDSLLDGVVDFMDAEFVETAYFARSDFRGEAEFSGVEFCSIADFSFTSFSLSLYCDETVFNRNALFVEAEFRGSTTFVNTYFQGLSDFNGAKFHNRAFFRDAIFEESITFAYALFKGEASFSRVKCFSDCSFSNATFMGTTSFNIATFTGDIRFSSATFTDDASFNGATFERDANFDQTTFEKFINFSDARFYQNAKLESLHGERGFSLANVSFVHQVPDFSQAHVKEAPRLDNVKITPKSRLYNLKRLWHLTKEISKDSNTGFRQPVWYIKQRLPGKNLRYWAKHRLDYMWDVFRNHRRDEDEEARYRSLKRLAIQAHDHVNELEFSAGEVRARRYIRDFPWPWQNGLSSSFKYWTGVLYDLSSDFGRSLWRPAFLWALVFYLFSSLYLSNATELAGNACKNSTDMTPHYAANTIAAKNSLLFLGMDRTDKLKRAYACLYGASSLYAEADKATSKPRQKTGYDKLPNTQKHLAPNVPPLMSFLGIVHSVLSLTLIFLLLLAIRNQFKIK